MSLDAHKTKIDWLDDFLRDFEEDICARDRAVRDEKAAYETDSQRVLAQTKAELADIAEKEAAMDIE